MWGQVFIILKSAQLCQYMESTPLLWQYNGAYRYPSKAYLNEVSHLKKDMHWKGTRRQSSVHITVSFCKVREKEQIWWQNLRDVWVKKKNSIWAYVCIDLVHVSTWLLHWCCVPVREVIFKIKEVIKEVSNPSQPQAESMCLAPFPMAFFFRNSFHLQALSLISSHISWGGSATETYVGKWLQSWVHDIMRI